MSRFDEADMYLIAFFIFLFLLITFNPSLGQIYMGMAIGAYLLYKSEGFRSYPLYRESWLKSVAIGAVAYAVFIYGTSIVLNQMGFVEFTPKAVAAALIGATLLATMVLKQSLHVTVASFGVAIPFVETATWARAMEWLGDMLRIPLVAKFKFGIVSLVTILAGIAVWFHTQAKGITNNPELVAVFIFFALSLVMILVFKETLAAITMHIISNTIAILSQYGTTITDFLFNPVFIGFAVVVYFVYRQGLLSKLRVLG